MGELGERALKGWRHARASLQTASGGDRRAEYALNLLLLDI